MRRLLLLAALLAAPLARAEAPTELTSGRAEKIKLAVMDLSAVGVPPELATTVTSLVANELERQEVFDVVSKAEIRAMLSHEAAKQALGCEAGADCMSNLGGVLGVRYLVSGSLGKLGDTYSLNLALTDAQASKVEGRVSETAKEQPKLLEIAARSSKQLVSKILQDRQATLLVTCAELGATVKIDGQVVGTTPLARRRISWGPHLIEVEKQGFVSHIEDFTVLTKGIVERHATMIPSPDFLESYEGSASRMRLGAWLSTGAAAVALGATGWFQLEHDRLAGDFKEALGRYDQTTDAWNALASTKAEAESRIGYAQVSAGIGLASAVAATYFWIAGADPDRYARYREVASADPDDAGHGPRVSLRFFDGSALVGAAVELP